MELIQLVIPVVVVVVVEQEIAVQAELVEFHPLALVVWQVEWAQLREELGVLALVLRVQVLLVGLSEGVVVEQGQLVVEPLVLVQQVWFN